MNKTEKLTILSDAEGRGYMKLADASTVEEINTALNWIVNVADVKEKVFYAEDHEPTREQIKDAYDEVCKEVAQLQAEAEPVEEPAKPKLVEVTETAADEEPPAYTKEDVRALLARARLKNVNITALIKQLGYDCFNGPTGVPESEYPTLVKMAEAAIAAASDF